MERAPAQISPPDPGSFAGFDELGVAAILVFVIFLILGNVALIAYAFYTQKIMLVSTSDQLIGNEAKRADLAQQDADEWKVAVRRIAEDSNANLARALAMRDEAARRGNP